MEIKQGQIYLAADGGKYGCVVVDTEKYSKIKDVVVISFSFQSGFHLVVDTVRIDAYKLTYRYYLVENFPEWVPAWVVNYHKQLKGKEM